MFILVTVAICICMCNLLIRLLINCVYCFTLNMYGGNKSSAKHSLHFNVTNLPVLTCTILSRTFDDKTLKTRRLAIKRGALSSKRVRSTSQFHFAHMYMYTTR